MIGGDQRGSELIGVIGVDRSDQSVSELIGADQSVSELIGGDQRVSELIGGDRR